MRSVWTRMYCARYVGFGGVFGVPGVAVAGNVEPGFGVLSVALENAPVSVDRYHYSYKERPADIERVSRTDKVTHLIRRRVQSCAVFPSRREVAEVVVSDVHRQRRRCIALAETIALSTPLL